MPVGTRGLRSQRLRVPGSTPGLRPTRAWEQPRRRRHVLRLSPSKAAGGGGSKPRSLMMAGTNRSAGAVRFKLPVRDRTGVDAELLGELALEEAQLERGRRSDCQRATMPPATSQHTDLFVFHFHFVVLGIDCDRVSVSLASSLGVSRSHLTNAGAGSARTPAERSRGSSRDDIPTAPARGGSSAARRGAAPSSSVGSSGAAGGHLGSWAASG